MDKEELIRFDGTVLEALSDGRFSVQLDNGHKILKKARIRVLTGDRVTVEMTPYDLPKGRISFRQKSEPIVPPTPRRRPQFVRS